MCGEDLIAHKLQFLGVHFEHTNNNCTEQRDGKNGNQHYRTVIFCSDHHAVTTSRAKLAIFLRSRRQISKRRRTWIYIVQELGAVVEKNISSLMSENDVQAVAKFDRRMRL
jgi:hypothetical protein